MIPPVQLDKSLWRGLINKNKKPDREDLPGIFGGESEIRTHGTVLAFTRFPGIRQLVKFAGRVNKTGKVIQRYVVVLGKGYKVVHG